MRGVGSAGARLPLLGELLTMKWKDLTPDNLRTLASNLDDTAHDHEIDRESMLEEQGFDVVAAEESVARFLKREAKRREKKAEGLPTVMPPPDPLPPDGTYDATFHRVQDGYPDGWPRAVFVDSDGEPVGVRCGPHEAAAIEAGAKALIEVAALRAGVAKFVEGAKVNATDGRRCLLSTNHADHDALAGLVKS